MSYARGRGAIGGIIMAAALVSVACSSEAGAPAASGANDAAPPADAAPSVEAGSDAGGPLSLGDAGGGFDAQGCACQTSATPLMAVTGASCTFGWPAGTKIVPERMNVELVHTDADGGSLIVPEDATNGWTFDDVNAPTKVLLHGSACTTYESATSPEVDLLLGCYTLVPPAC